MGEYELGTKETIQGKLEPKPVEVIDVQVVQQQMKDKKTGKDISKEIVNVHCKHPDKEETIEIRKAEVREGKTLEVRGLWVTLDEENKINKNSALGRFMQHTQINRLKDLKGEKLETTTNDGGFLVFKAYK